MDMNVKNCTKNLAIKLKIVDMMTFKKSSPRWYFATFSFCATDPCGVFRQRLIGATIRLGKPYHHNQVLFNEKKPTSLIILSTIYLMEFYLKLTFYTAVVWLKYSQYGVKN